MDESGTLGADGEEVDPMTLKKRTPPTGLVVNIPQPREQVGEHGAGIKRLAPPGFHTMSEAAALVGRSPDTLRRWRRMGTAKHPDGTPIPDSFMRRGALMVYLWSDKDIAELKRQITNRSIA